VSRILGPHKEQDGWVYVRAARVPKPTVDRDWPIDDATHDGSPVYRLIRSSGRFIDVAYGDGNNHARTISSRRVEEAVETADYLKRCAEEGLTAGRVPFWSELEKQDDGSWKRHVLSWVWHVAPLDRADLFGEATTLREAYHRYHNRRAE
jgi:hypothetical protein